MTTSFSSTDPVFGGNSTGYAYPQDPVNHSDTSGAWCIAQMGTTCTRYVTTSWGLSVPVRKWVRDKVLIRHNITWDTMQYVIKHMWFDHVDQRNGRDVYAVRLFHYICTDGQCDPDGQTMLVKTVVDWGPSTDGKTMGVLTMFCRTPGTLLCPNWVNAPHD